MIFKLLLSVFLALPQVALTSQGTLEKFLPKDGDVEDWAKHRPMQHFAGEDLYEYINGGAEIYHEYGFVQVVVQDYVNDAEKSVSVEIYEMTSSASAYGMYTFKTNSKGKRISVGHDAQLADYYMNFWKGHFLVTLTGFDETEDTREGLLVIAKSVNSKISTEGEKPRIVSLLPEEDLVDESFKYFKGFVGLRNSYPFFGLNILGYEEGIKGDYSGGFSFFLFRFEEEQESQKASQSMRAQKDRRGRSLFVVAYREYLMMVLGTVDSMEAEQVFGRAKEKIRGRK
ncbi:MAG: hypothetical protein JSV17_03215 [Candidatus Aminicenantes bacterium]|nr:MAG: hypothetical protein JSV17_03215 [Candidatus Aminicenantes bacterium]